MHFTLSHKNRKKTSVRHTLQTFITLSHWFLIFVNKRGRMKEDERTGTEGDGGRDTLDVGGRDALGVGGRGTEATVLLRRGHASKWQYSEASKGYHSRTRVSAPRPPWEDLCQLLEDEKRWLMEDVARRPPSYYGLFYKYINIQRHTVIV